MTFYLNIFKTISNLSQWYLALIDYLDSKILYYQILPDIPEIGKNSQFLCIMQHIY